MKRLLMMTAAAATALLLGGLPFVWFNIVNLDIFFNIFYLIIRI